MTIQYLVYDIESIVDKQLLNRVLYQDKGLADQEAFSLYIKKIEEEKGNNFPNPAFHVPVCIAAIAVDKDFTIQKIGLLGEEKRTPGAIVKHFWDMYNRGSFILVDFNGRGYDLRLMELWAFRQGIPIHYKHFDKFGVRYRYSDDKHLDLHEVVTNNMSIRYQGGLNLLAKMLNKPGKMETNGAMVQDLHDQNKIDEIEDYCLGDALDTYFVFLRWKVVRGSLSLAQETDLVEKARERIKQHANETGQLKKYLERFGSWAPWE
ncbi:MAG: 3'-5' exonuclease [Deltaproteobacteria bacterium]|nr:3'-5' exonuclease [Deltaproteobacteria bacterium]